MAGKKVNCKQIKEDIAIAAPRPQIFADAFEKHANILFVQYKPGVNPDEVLQKMIPIGLEWKTEGYQYTEKYVKQYVLQLLRITDLFMPVFLCRSFYAGLFMPLYRACVSFDLRRAFIPKAVDGKRGQYLPVWAAAKAWRRHQDFPF